MKRFFLLSFFLSFGLYSQDYFIVNDGVKTKEYGNTAFTNANIYTDKGVISNSTLIINDGKIINYGRNIDIPKNTVIYDLGGRYIYPSFVETFSNFGIEKYSRSDFSRSSQYEPSRKGYYWNDHILSDYNAFDNYIYNKSDADKMRKMGFGVVNSNSNDGVHRGTSFTVALIDDKNESYRLIQDKSSEYYSFSKSSRYNQSYPNSTMGAIALIRQLFHDANWYSQGVSNTKDLALEALIENKDLPKFFDAGEKLNVIRAAKLSNEFNLNFVIKGSGKEYENIRELKKFDNTIIVPINFPKAYDVSNPLLNKKLTINQLRYWNQAPANLKILDENNIEFIVTSSGINRTDDFLENLRTAVKHGLNIKKAIESLTIVPARSLNLGDKLGKIEKNFLANFIITSGPLFDDETEIDENWVKGNRHIINPVNTVNFDGEYEININGNNYNLIISNSQDNINTRVKKDSINLKSKTSLQDDWLYLTIFDEYKSKASYAQLSAKIISENTISGLGIDFNNDEFKFKTTSNRKLKKSKGEDLRLEAQKVSKLTYPNVGFGLTEVPKSKSIHFKNATLWTNEDLGIVENYDILISKGKIVEIGKDISTPPGYEVVDATGKHITSGIIDEHSHMAASSINEGGHNSSAEVSIMDVINPDDVNIYRNLAGGVTTVQILHGSANPIGGQSAIIKLKWGSEIEDMFFEGAAPFIKFALGENVKQSNWGGSRFPQTRMGVEQVFIDHFDRASEYANNWTEYNSLNKREKSRTPKPRFDEELETLWEIMKGERFISSHSYVQSEINMLMKVAEKYNFRINTFTHILEGYKVADKMREHGVAASTFSDWWGYKYEVNDAIPYNASIMHNAGVLVALNSDSSELSRRLNLEAAKAVKYGGVSETEAWKFVTLNPAKMLHLDHKVGSLKEGKDADIVLWSGHPMSLYSRAEMTFIEGALYFDENDHERRISEIKNEKSELISLMFREIQAEREKNLKEIFEDNTSDGNQKFPIPDNILMSGAEIISFPELEVNCETIEIH